MDFTSGSFEWLAKRFALEENAMDAEVHWEGRLVGYLRDVTLDQPYYHGDWSSAGDPAFEQAYAEMQQTISPSGLGVLAVTFRSPDGDMSAPAAAMVRPAPAEPYFRFGNEDLQSHVLHWPCPKCGDSHAHPPKPPECDPRTSTT